MDIEDELVPCEGDVVWVEVEIKGRVAERREGHGAGESHMARSAYDVHTDAVGFGDVVAAVGWSQHLQRDQQDVDELAKEKETECAKFEQSNGRVAEIETIETKHAQKDGQQQRRLERVPIRRLTLHRQPHLTRLVGHVGTLGIAHQARPQRTLDRRQIVHTAASRLLRGSIDVGRRALILAHLQMTTINRMQITFECSIRIGWLGRCGHRRFHQHHHRDRHQIYQHHRLLCTNLTAGSQTLTGSRPSSRSMRHPYPFVNNHPNLKISMQTNITDNK